MKEVWAYLRWQHKINGNGMFYLGLYSILGFTIKRLDDDLGSRIISLIFIIAIWGMNFRSLYEKKLKNQELMLPISKNKRIFGVFIYFLISLFIGLVVAWLSMKIYMYFVFIGIVILYGIKNGFYNKENFVNTDLRKLVIRREKHE